MGDHTYICTYKITYTRMTVNWNSVKDGYDHDNSAVVIIMTGHTVRHALEP